MTKKPKAESRRPVTRADFIGAKMANFLYSMAQNSALPQHERAEAKKLYEQWDSVCLFRLNNPIVIAELEQAMAAGEMK
jgi:hypothetical protein